MVFYGVLIEYQFDLFTILQLTFLAGFVQEYNKFLAKSRLNPHGSTLIMW